MSRDLARLKARIFNTPLLVTPEVAETIAANLAERFNVAPIKPPAALSPTGTAGLLDAPEPYGMAGDVAVVPVRGELINRGSWMDAYSGLTSYEALGAALRQAELDTQVRAIVLDIDSPGGEASGAMETAAIVREIASVKPVVAYVNSLAASAAYAIAAGANEIVTTPSATLGSIGVVWLHLDRSKMMDEAGLKPTLLHAGAYKTDGNSLEPLNAKARGRIQTQIDQVYDLFTASVGAHRPKLGQDGAKATEAGVFMGQGAVDAGLADRVGDLSFALQRATVRASRVSRGARLAESLIEQSLHIDVSPRAGLRAALLSARQGLDPFHALAVLNEESSLLLDSPPSDETQEMTAMADAQAAEAARNEGFAAGLAQGLLQGAEQAKAAERQRLSLILGDAEAKGREDVARHLALSTDLSAESAVALLAISPKAEPPKRDLAASVPRPAIAPDAAEAQPLTEYEAGAAEAANLLRLAGRAPKRA